MRALLLIAVAWFLIPAAPAPAPLNDPMFVAGNDGGQNKKKKDDQKTEEDYALRLGRDTSTRRA